MTLEQSHFSSPHGGGGELIRILNDLGLESEIPDFIARSESAKNDLFSKCRLLPFFHNCEILLVNQFKAQPKLVFLSIFVSF